MPARRRRPGSGEALSPASTRVVLLGASNLTLSLRIVLGAPARWERGRPVPAHRTFVGWRAVRAQPSARLADGTPVFLF